MVRLTDLPPELIARIFVLLSPYPSLSNGSLKHASNAFALAQCSKQLLQIFRQTLLTSIDARNYASEPVSPYFPGAEVRDPYHLSSLVRLAGPYLRKIMIPEYEESEEFSLWPLLEDLVQCVNLETLGFHDPQDTGYCLKQLVGRVPRLRIVNTASWTLRNIGRVRAIELVSVSASVTNEVLAMITRCRELNTFSITFSHTHDAKFTPLLVHALVTSATCVVHVSYRCPSPPPPTPHSPQPQTRALATLRIDAGGVTKAVIEAFSCLIDINTYVTTIYPMMTLVKLGDKIGITRSVGILGPAQNLEEVVVTRVEEAAYVIKHSTRLRIMEIGKDCDDVTGICTCLAGKRLEKVVIPGDLISEANCNGLAGVKEIEIRELGNNNDIWKLVSCLPGLLRGLRWAGRSGGGVRVIHVVGCLQVLDGVWQYGRINGYGILRGLLWEMERLYEELGVEFCGLREGVSRLVEERERLMVIDEM